MMSLFAAMGIEPTSAVVIDANGVRATIQLDTLRKVMGP